MGNPCMTMARVWQRSSGIGFRACLTNQGVRQSIVAAIMTMAR